MQMTITMTEHNNEDEIDAHRASSKAAKAHKARSNISIGEISKLSIENGTNASLGVSYRYSVKNNR